MSSFRVDLTAHAVEDLEGIGKENKKNILRDLLALKSAPYSSGTRIKRLKGFRPPLYRLRCGDFRVLYQIREDTVAVLRVIDRKLLERIIKRLKL
jgi:mRNA interferase RelE/StbE